mmetsp:Transcript_123289/g.356228  ORF Transcript_123289/g.356228 Transcript_123289/m.356228 type:complete len:111 (-) Transcript_123289:293-625(-)|eukprot:CAMPEP_0176018810 /NCGR_PEP_ID=MMETSP0120_2-20121206/9068_1 /TAXON_ID=160619 /ORGANISM="Kryptoperidinium foliaceum, Strain CCMP 1326" /LENGTH=110 /DNA_ID=CAMNT_0017351869 /DNA_START=149 /DNA_END=481 /DNA_ORIENTATION=+
MAPTDKTVGGIKGFFLKAGKSFQAGGEMARDWSWWLAQKGGRIGLVLASTSMVVLMPLIFEINREVQMIASERIQVSELRNQGHSDRQLQEMGFLEAALHSPSVASLKAK